MLNKKLLWFTRPLGILSLLLVAFGVTMVIAATSMTFNQSLTVPETEITIYGDVGLTVPISNGEDLTQYWSWDGAKFVLELYIKNTGDTAIDDVDVTDDDCPWTLTSVGTGSIAVGSSKKLTVNVTPPSPSGTSGSFSIDVGVV